MNVCLSGWVSGEQLTCEAKGEKGKETGCGHGACRAPQPPLTADRPRRHAVQLPAYAAAVRPVCAHMVTHVRMWS